MGLQDLTVKNTFVHVAEQEPEIPALVRTQSEYSARKTMTFASTAYEEYFEGETTPKLHGLESYQAESAAYPQTPETTPRASNQHNAACAAAFKEYSNAASMGYFQFVPFAAQSAGPSAGPSSGPSAGPAPIPNQPSAGPVEAMYPQYMMMMPEMMHAFDQYSQPSYMQVPTPQQQVMPLQSLDRFAQPQPRYLESPFSPSAGPANAYGEDEEELRKRRPRRRRSRRTEPVKPEVGAKVFVGGLGPQTTSATLRAYFAQFGRILDAAVLADSETKRSRGFGFVDFAVEIPQAVLVQEHIIEQRRCGVRPYEYCPPPQPAMAA